jgi:hypothetical protein
MILGPLVNLASGYVQSLFSNPAAGTTQAGITQPGSANASGTSQLSPFAQVLSNLQQLEQSSPIQYATVTRQIAGGLQTAAQSATASGYNGLAGTLNQLSSDFSSASTTSQLPNVQDLAQLIGAGTSTSTSTAANGATSNLNQFLQSLKASQSGNPSLSAQSIIDSTLSSAGL